MMVLKIIKNNKVMALLLSLYSWQTVAMQQAPNQRRSPSSQLSPSPVRSSSPTQLKVYLSSDRMEPHRSISQKDLTQLNKNLTDRDESELRINLRNSHGYSPLEHAIQSGFMEGIVALMNKGANPAITNEETWQNSFHVGAVSGTNEMIRYLIVRAKFTNVQESLEEARRIVIETAEAQRGLLFKPHVEELCKQHIMQISFLVTQTDLHGNTPENLALHNNNLSEGSLNSKQLEQLYGAEIADRYMTELVTLVT